jgi:hypothetical protein
MIRKLPVGDSLIRHDRHCPSIAHSLFVSETKAETIRLYNDGLSTVRKMLALLYVDPVELPDGAHASATNILLYRELYRVTGNTAFLY